MYYILAKERNDAVVSCCHTDDGAMRAAQTISHTLSISRINSRRNAAPFGNANPALLFAFLASDALFFVI